MPKGRVGHNKKEGKYIRFFYYDKEKSPESERCQPKSSWGTETADPLLGAGCIFLIFSDRKPLQG